MTTKLRYIYLEALLRWASPGELRSSILMRQFVDRAVELEVLTLRREARLEKVKAHKEKLKEVGDGLRDLLEAQEAREPDAADFDWATLAWYAGSHFGYDISPLNRRIIRFCWRRITGKSLGSIPENLRLQRAHENESFEKAWDEALQEEANRAMGFVRTAQAQYNREVVEARNKRKAEKRAQLEKKS